MRIVQLGAGDGDLLERAVRQFRGVPGVRCEDFLADPSAVVMVVLDGADVAGWAWGWRQRHVCGYSQLQLYEVEVVPGFRRRGVGRELVSAFLALGRSEGHAKVYLFTGAGNAAAKALYESLGGVASAADETGFSWQIS